MIAMQEHTRKYEGINGVFSSQEVKRVGTGTTTRKTIQKTFWFCIEGDDEEIEVQPLNVNYVPSGPKKKISKDDFLARFSPEPEMYVTNVFPKMRELNKTIARAERYRSNKEYYSAEMEFNNALQVDEENVRANFGLGITYLERGESGKANNIFERLVKLDAAFQEEHKHLFNEFGINLRKNKMIDQAITYYARAEELAVQDEHLFYNMARAYLEKQDMGNALRCLCKSLDMNPRLEVSIKFLMWLLTNNRVPEDQKPEAARAVRKIKEAREEDAARAEVAESPRTGSAETAGNA
jgi:tetratricopeptide (TPR) repeat protein